MVSWLKQYLFCLHGILFISFCRALIECECTTDDCAQEGFQTCKTDHWCYVERMSDMVYRGCIYDRTPLLCENRRPKKLQSMWPMLYCCKDGDFCNREVEPSPPPPRKTDEPIKESIDPKLTDTSSSQNKCANSAEQNGSGKEGTKIINPIYIAVPVAGVCVLLALIIFAMYLLRRRNDYYETYHGYHEHVPTIPPTLQCTDAAKAAQCSHGKINRCTDSERSSSGSETKLFLQV